jgi:nondiscriminating glutamyl-tRNA synthetase
MLRPYVTILLMLPDEHSDAPVAAANPFNAADILGILRERGWLTAEPAQEQQAWCEKAAAYLGGQAADRAALEELLSLVFQYDAREILGRVESHIVMTRYAARDVLRQMGPFLLDEGPLTTDKFKEMITALKERMDLRGRELFHPIRLALAGRAGEGELDRVILLLDDAAVAFEGKVKSARERIVEFCSVLG